MTEKNKWYKWVIIFLLGYIFFLLNLPKGTKPREIIIEKSDTIQICDTAYIKDTLIFEKVRLVPKEVYITKVDTVFDNNLNPIELITENKTYQDTIICDKDTAELQIFTSGIKSNVDSINLSLRKSNPVITNTITVTKYVKNNKRLSLGLQLGYGYAFKSKELSPYVGIGLNVKI